MMNRVIFNNEVYYRATDIREELGYTAYKFKKYLQENEVTTYKLKGFGNGNFIKESDTDLQYADNEDSVLILGTKVKDYSEKFTEVVKINEFLGAISNATEEVRAIVNEQNIVKFNNDWLSEKQITTNEPNQYEIDRDEQMTINNELLEDNNLAYRYIKLRAINPNHTVMDKSTIEYFLVDNENKTILNEMEDLVLTEGGLATYNCYDDITTMVVSNDNLQMGEIEIDNEQVILNLREQIENGMKIQDEATEGLSEDMLMSLVNIKDSIFIIEK